MLVAPTVRVHGVVPEGSRHLPSWEVCATWSMSIDGMTYFQFDGVLYQQVHGAPMGSLVSVVVAVMFIENVEQFTMSSTPPGVKPKIWKRYMYINDSFEVMKEEQRNSLTEHLSSMDTMGSIKFTD